MLPLGSVLRCYNSPWTARPYNWYILTSLTESLYLERLTGDRLRLPPDAAALAGSLRSDTILAGMRVCLHNTSDSTTRS